MYKCFLVKFQFCSGNIKLYSPYLMDHESKPDMPLLVDGKIVFFKTKNGAVNFMRNHFLHNLELPLVGEVAHIRHFSRPKKLYAARRKIFIVASYCERRTVYRGFEYHSVEAVLAAY